MLSLNRRQFLHFSAGSAAALLASACAPAASPPSGDAGSSVAPMDGSLAYQGEIEFWDWNYDPREVLLNRFIEEWEAENPGITLTRSALPYGDAQTRLLTAVSAGNNPPFNNVHNIWRFQLQKAGALVPYPEGLLQYDNLISTPFNRDSETGSVYTCTFNYYCDLMFANISHLEEEGIDPADLPTSWDDYFRMAQQLTRRSSDGRFERVGMTLNHYYSRQWLWQTLVYQMGGFLYNEAGTEALWNGDEGVEALQMIKDVYYTYEIDDLEGLGLFEAFENQNASTYISQGYTANGIDDNPDMVGNWTTAPTPRLDGDATPAWGVVSPEEGFAVFTNATEEEQAVGFSFIEKIISGEEQALTWAIVQNGPPDRADLLDDERLYEEDEQNVIRSQADTLPFRVNPGEQPLQAEDLWRNMFDRVLLQDEDPQTVLDDVTAAMNEALAAASQPYLITERNYEAPSQ